MDAEYAGCRVLSIFLSVSMLGAFQLSLCLSLYLSLTAHWVRYASRATSLE